jgi:hypothetical protein
MQALLSNTLMEGVGGKIAKRNFQTRRSSDQDSNRRRVDYVSDVLSGTTKINITITAIANHYHYCNIHFHFREA